MSRTTERGWLDNAKLVWEVTCPRCGSDSGSLCTNSDGSRALKYPHAERRETARQSFGVGTKGPRTKSIPAMTPSQSTPASEQAMTEQPQTPTETMKIQTWSDLKAFINGLTDDQLKHQVRVLRESDNLVVGGTEIMTEDQICTDEYWEGVSTFTPEELEGEFIVAVKGEPFLCEL